MNSVREIFPDDVTHLHISGLAFTVADQMGFHFIMSHYMSSMVSVEHMLCFYLSVKGSVLIKREMPSPAYFWLQMSVQCSAHLPCTSVLQGI